MELWSFKDEEKSVGQTEILEWPRNKYHYFTPLPASPRWNEDPSTPNNTLTAKFKAEN